MKKMHILLILSLVFLLSACGDKDKTEQGALPVIQEGKALSDKQLDLATNATFPPYEFYDGEAMVGIDIDIAKAVADSLGYTVKMHDMEFNNIIASIESGKTDGGIAGMTITDERKENVDFSIPYAKSVQVVIVTEDSPIQTIDDLEGKKIGTQLGTTGDIYATDDFGEKNVQSFDKHSDAIMALESGRVDCVMVDEQTAKSFINTKDTLKLLDTAYADEEYAIALPKGNTALVEEINTVLKALQENGTIQTIVDKYIK